LKESSSGILVALSSRALFVRVIGRGAYRNSAPLRQLGEKSFQEGCTACYVDLGECQSMDSTFLGLLAGFGLALRGKGRLYLYNTNRRTAASLGCLGLDRLAQIDPGKPEEVARELPPEAAFWKLPGTDLTAKAGPLDDLATARLILECHEDLCRTDERNEPKFKDVKHLLREDLARLQSKA